MRVSRLLIIMYGGRLRRSIRLRIENDRRAPTRRFRVQLRQPSVTCLYSESALGLEEGV